MSKCRRVLGLDFDGVLWNSVRECFVIAQEAWEEVGMAPFTQSYERFRAGRWLVRSGHEFGVLMRLLEDQPDLDPQKYTAEQFAELLQKHAEWLEKYGQAFWQTRARYRKERPEEWCKLQAPFPQVIANLPIWREHFVDVVVATTKDTESTRFLLQSAGLDLPVFGIEVGTDKSKHMHLLIDKYAVEPENVYFIDDLLINLQDAAKAGVTCHLALWGYNTPESQKRAVELGYRLLGEDQLPALGTD